MKTRFAAAVLTAALFAALGPASAQQAPDEALLKMLDSRARIAAATTPPPQEAVIQESAEEVVDIASAFPEAHAYMEASRDGLADASLAELQAFVGGMPPLRIGCEEYTSVNFPCPVCPFQAWIFCWCNGDRHGCALWNGEVYTVTN